MFNFFNKKKKISKNFELIIELFDNLIENEFKCNKNDMVDNGEIFYFNGDNGSKFDWFENGHTSTLATIYPDGTEALKIHIYQDGSIKSYFYNKGSMKPDNELSTKISEDLAKEIAILLYTVSDSKNLFDKRLSALDLTYNLTEKDIDSFYNESI